MSIKPLNGKNNREVSSATPSRPSPADFPLGSPQSRAAARAMLEKRMNPRRSEYDEDALTIYRGVAYLTSPRTGWQVKPSSWELRGNTIYERGQDLSFAISPIIPSHLDERGQRWTPESSEFEIGFGREPQPGDILRYEHVALLHHPEFLEVDCHIFTEAWNRRMPGLPCPKKVESGRLFIRSVRRYQGKDEEDWVEDIDVQPKAIWREFERYIKWLALGKPKGLKMGPLNLSLEDIPTIHALTFLGVGPREECGGFVYNKHRCRPSTEEERAQPDPEPTGGILKEIADLSRRKRRAEV